MSSGEKIEQKVAWNASEPWKGPWSFTAQAPGSPIIVEVTGHGKTMAEAWENACIQLWSFSARHPTTGETIEFKGQGKTMHEAGADGAKNCGDTFMPSQSGGQRKPGETNGARRVACRQKDGTIILKSLREFEAGTPTPAAPTFPPVPAPKVAPSISEDVEL